jgi:class 3 adenylate cyclase
MMRTEQARVLIVDDNQAIRELLSAQLQTEGYRVAVAANGYQALERLKEEAFDLVLLDITMPSMNGYQVLEHLRADPILRHIPVVVISALDDLDSIVTCIKLGAEDYLFKPFNTVLLKARVSSCLEKKWLRDQEQAYLKQLEAEQAKSEHLLLNILPQPIAHQLKQGYHIIADSFPEVTVLFADISDFTQLSARLSPKELIELLNRVFSAFDRLSDQYGLEKIKTIGDAYMVVGGLPKPRADHAEAVAAMALDMLEEVAQLSTQSAKPLSIRIGMHIGPVVAGVIGEKKIAYDLWGDTVNIASRMETHGLPGHIQTTQALYDRLRNRYEFQKRGIVDVKGKGQMVTYLLTRRKAPLAMELQSEVWLAQAPAAASA